MRGIAAQALGQLGSADEAVLKGLLALASDKNAESYVRGDAYSLETTFGISRVDCHLQGDSQLNLPIS